MPISPVRKTDAIWRRSAARALFPFPDEARITAMAQRENRQAGGDAGIFHRMAPARLPFWAANGRGFRAGEEIGFRQAGCPPPAPPSVAHVRDSPTSFTDSSAGRLCGSQLGWMPCPPPESWRSRIEVGTEWSISRLDLVVRATAPEMQFKYHGRLYDGPRARTIWRRLGCAHRADRGRWF